MGQLIDIMAHPARAKSIMQPLMVYGGALVAGIASAKVVGSALPAMEAVHDRPERAHGEYMKSLARKEFERMDLKKTGTIDMEEAAAAGISKEKFSKMDYNHDGAISYEEFLRGIRENVMDGVEVNWGPRELQRQAEKQGVVIKDNSISAVAGGFEYKQ